MAKTTTAHFVCYTAPGTLADSVLPYIHKKLEDYRLGILQLLGEPSKKNSGGWCTRRKSGESLDANDKGRVGHWPAPICCG
jgi:hypothetical protein